VSNECEGGRKVDCCLEVSRTRKFVVEVGEERGWENRRSK